MTPKGIGIMALVFILAVFGFVFYMIYTVLSGVLDDDFGLGWLIYAFLGIFFLMMAVPIVFILGAMIKKKTPVSAYGTYQTADPMMYDNRGGTSCYCRFCGDNIGNSHPKFCPECGKSLKY